MTRNGKIARLPAQVRKELNQRLDDGEPGKQLVAWLNGLPEVRNVLERDFPGRVVTEQNLSEWKQGGFLDWQRHQESLECVRTAAEQAQELAAEAGLVPLTDALSASVALLLTKLIRSVESGAESTPESRRELLSLIREWTALRQGDHKAAMLKMQQDDWNRARATVADAERKAAEETAKAQAYANSEAGKIAEFDKKYQAVEHDVIRETAKVMSRISLIHNLCSGLPKENAKKLRDHIEGEIHERREVMLEAFTKEMMADAAAEFPSESKSIRSDPTCNESTEQDSARITAVQSDSERSQSLNPIPSASEPEDGFPISDKSSRRHSNEGRACLRLRHRQRENRARIATEFLAHA